MESNHQYFNFSLKSTQKTHFLLLLLEYIHKEYIYFYFSSYV